MTLPLKSHASKLAKSLLWRLASLSGLAGKGLGRGAVVLGLHRVAPSPRPGGLDCPPPLFAAICRFLARNFTPVPLPVLAEDLRSGRPVAGKLAVSFDDGYRDNLLAAAPILLRHGLPATFFITSGFMGRAAPPPWDLEAGDARPMMDWDDVRRLAGMGFDIGGHTRTHRNLAALPEAEAREEIEGCRRDIARELGQPPAAFAYPFGGPGHVTPGLRELVRRAGFSCCCALTGGMVRGGDDPFALDRVPVSDWYLSPAHLGGDLLVKSLKDRLL